MPKLYKRCLTVCQNNKKSNSHLFKIRAFSKCLIRPHCVRGKGDKLEMKILRNMIQRTHKKITKSKR